MCPGRAQQLGATSRRHMADRQKRHGATTRDELGNRENHSGAGKAVENTEGLEQERRAPVDPMGGVGLGSHIVPGRDGGRRHARMCSADGVEGAPGRHVTIEMEP